MTYTTQWLERIKTADARAAFRAHGDEHARTDKNATRLNNGDIRFATY